jgi:branched-chain amino acid transport system substrate-binding protein
LSAGLTTAVGPTLTIYESWVGTDVMITGIAAAGPHPTQAGTIKAMRSVISYDGGGLLPTPIDLKAIFGHDQAKTCDRVIVVQAKGFAPISTNPGCGHDVPGTSLAPSSS